MAPVGATGGAGAGLRVGHSAGRMQPAAGRRGWGATTRGGATSARTRTPTRALPLDLPASGSGGGPRGPHGGDSGGGGGSWGDGPGAAALALPMAPTELSRELLTPWNVVLLVACLALPWFGVILHRRRVDEYILASLALSFLQPLGSLFALAVVFLRWEPLKNVPVYVSLISSTLLMFLC
mmetsp:Transcript_34926/g.89361  ORF Transcript_34926/g.89361 Transcript_34926/m.89361 type:complete len:181 (-) Transcript_34926:228-770(-)|eukprot:jgi/Tetstr1/422251/TSEL_013103.t1